MSQIQQPTGEGETWYLAQLKPGGLERAKTNLARQGYESFMPLRPETHRRAGQWHKSNKPLFPGYLFVKVGDESPNWPAINSTYGVARLVSLEHGSPTHVAPAIIQALRVRVGEDGTFQAIDTLGIGDQVRVFSGPFADKIAQIEAIPERDRIYVLLEFMGRYSRVELLAADVERHLPAKRQSVA